MKSFHIWRGKKLNQQTQTNTHSKTETAATKKEKLAQVKEYFIV